MGPEGTEPTAGVPQNKLSHTITCPARSAAFSHQILDSSLFCVFVVWLVDWLLFELDTGSLVKTAPHEGLALTQPACLGITILSGLFGRPCSRVVNHSGFGIGLTRSTFPLLHCWVE